MTVQQLGLRRKLAVLDFEDGQYLEAERGLTGLVDELRESTDAGAGYELGRALIDRATARRSLNRWDDAAADVDECERRASSMPDVAASGLLTNAYIIRAQLHLTEQWAGRDTLVATAALDALVASGTRGWWVHETRASLAYRERDWEQAATRYVQVAAAVEREGWGRGVAVCELRAGTALLELGRVEEADSHLRPAHAHFSERGPSDLRAEAERQLARLLVLQAQPDEAWEHISIALSLVETSVRRFRSLFDQQRYLADKDAYYQHAFAVALAAGGDEGNLRALSVAERAKSFYLCQLLANADVPLFDGVDPAVVERLRELEDRLDTLESRARASGAAMEARTTLEAERDAVAREREQVFGELMREHPRWASAQVPLPFDAARDLASLPEGWCALSGFWLGTAELHFFLARPGEAVMHCSNVWSADELDALRASQEELRTATTGQLFVHPVIPAGLRERVLPPEILAMLAPDARILVSPHGVLRGVPLHLVAGRERAVQYIPSFALMNLVRAPEDAPSDILLLGCEHDGFGDPPLPGVRRELDAAAEIWGSKPIVLDETGRLGADAPAPETWDRYRVIQIACHGELDPQRPLDGALLLGRSALRMSELFTLRLNAELVCLSACDLGRLGESVGGVRQAGDEWLGFVMPLLYAGARSILVSLWKAHDRTAAHLVPELHKAIQHDREPADALRDALAAVEGAPEGFWTNWYLVGFPAGMATGTRQRGKDL